MSSYLNSSVFEFKVEPSLGPEDDEEILDHWFSFVTQGELKVPEDVGNHHPLLVQSKLLANAVPGKWGVAYRCGLGWGYKVHLPWTSRKWYVCM